MPDCVGAIQLDNVSTIIIVKSKNPKTQTKNPKTQPKNPGFWVFENRFWVFAIPGCYYQENINKPWTIENGNIRRNMFKVV